MQLSRELLDKLVKRVVQKVKANKLDVPFNAHTKIPLDVAEHIVYQLVTSPQPALIGSLGGPAQRRVDQAQRAGELADERVATHPQTVR